MATLGQLESDILAQLQQPGSAFPAPPTWSMLANPQYAQGIVDYYINRGYIRLMSDLAEWEIYLVRAVFPSIARQPFYPISPITTSAAATTLGSAITPGSQIVVTPPSIVGITPGTGLILNPGQPTQEVVYVSAVTAPTITLFQVNFPHAATEVLRGIVYPSVRQVRRFYYAPQQLLYSQEYVPGGDLISWNEFQRYTGKGFLTPFSYATQPGKAAVTPGRQYLALFSAPAASGDGVMIDYAPIPTAGADFCPMLVAETDTPVVEDDCCEAIVDWALSRLWMRERQAGASSAYLQLYFNELERIRTEYRKASSGDSMSFQQKWIGVGTLGSIGGLSGSGVGVG
jgi:hypothetical protein